MTLSLLLLLGVIVVGLAACSPADAAYEEEIEAYRRQRIEGLRRPDGWLALVGLYWLDEGEHSFGADFSNAVVFPPNAPPRIGTFVVEDSTVTMRVEPGVPITHDGQPVTELVMADDHDGEPTVVHLASLSWHVIERSGRLGVRLRDSESPVRTGFDGIETFPTDPRWRIEGRFERYDPPRTARLPTIIAGMDEESTVPGAVVFEVDGEEYRLDVTGAPDATQFFVVFGDATSGHETYGGGRFLYVDAPDDNGRVVIDFNKAYNPPCVFTPYATCPIPTRENRLPVRIPAGEKTWGDH
ncbi:MAG TPA: DUF1684 domain-containing protein [Rubricoccaceae bacterium]|nr:DUF1684 domain-containing protein [Rubricoccaceae bacterium]